MARLTTTINRMIQNEKHFEDLQSVTEYMGNKFSKNREFPLSVLLHECGLASCLRAFGCCVQPLEKTKRVAVFLMAEFVKDNMYLFDAHFPKLKPVRGTPHHAIKKAEEWLEKLVVSDNFFHGMYSSDFAFQVYGRSYHAARIACSIHLAIETVQLESPSDFGVLAENLVDVQEMMAHNVFSHDCTKNVSLLHGKLVLDILTSTEKIKVINPYLLPVGTPEERIERYRDKWKYLGWRPPYFIEDNYKLMTEWEKEDAR